MKLFKYSVIKNSIFLEAQEAMNLKPLKILKACTTRWLTHRESCIHFISRYEAVIAVLDEIYTKTHDPETKGIRDLLVTPKNILMILLLDEVLSPVSRLCQFVQRNRLNFCSIDNKINEVFKQLKIIKENISHYDVIDAPLNYLSKCVSLL